MDLAAQLNTQKTKLYKLHGSLNWLYGPTCNHLQLTPFQKGAARLRDGKNKQFRHCPECQSLFTPVIVPPTYFKNMSNVFLARVWNATERALYQVEHVVFCGDSFPDADVHIKYLLKRAQSNRRKNKPLGFTVVNYHQGKTPEAVEAERRRFERCLGKQNVTYTNMSFEEFANNPEVILATTAAVGSTRRPQGAEQLKEERCAYLSPARPEPSDGPWSPP